ncbi:hypothetical protein ACWF0M_25705 [Kribbella sp. NPDC055110]
MKRTQLVVATVTVAALATTGTASAAISGSDPKSGTVKSGAAAKGEAKPAKRTDLAKVAAQLGVTTDRLEAALVAAKMSLAGSTTVTPEAFVAAVAANLRLPVAQVKAAVEPLLLNPGRPRPGDGKQDGKESQDDKAKADGKKGADDPRNSPFASDAAAARLATALGVSQAKAKAALVALVSAPGGIVPTSKAFRDLAQSLGVSAARLNTALGDLKQSLDNG